MKSLQEKLKQLDGKGYKGYKSLQGKYLFTKYELFIDYVQGDPFASPSKIRIVVPEAYRKIKQAWKADYNRKVYAEDVIARSVAEAVDNNPFFSKGSGKSGLIMIDKPGQEILERTAVNLEKDYTTICLSIGLPANGRRINGKEAEKLFFKALPSILDDSIFSIRDQAIDLVVELADQHEAIRTAMKENNWVSFIADGAVLPRESGISNRPMEHAVPFQSPQENKVSIDIPHQAEPLTGMAFPKGIALIVGGGYHGKSTLLNAIEHGIYPHVHGDGREYVLTDPTAVKVRAEDGRQVTGVNISPFINDLPHQQDTNRFTTENASGSTSQAANVMEALEAGAGTLLIDEDTSATNFMIRDRRMQELVVKEKEPITPFIDKVLQLKEQLNVSTILVMGGSGDYFDAADHVIMMDNYRPENVTARAHQIASKYPYARDEESGMAFGVIPKRSFLSSSLQTRKGKKSKVQAKGLSTIIIGQSDLSLHYVEQLIDNSQTRMIAEIIRYLDQGGWLKKEQSLPELLDAIEKQMNEKGLDAFAAFPGQHPGDLARPRRFEVAAALNRLRTAKVKNI